MPKIKGVFDKKNVIVTGGAGFIGSHICENLVKRGEANVICIDNFASGHEMNIDHLLQEENFTFIKHDITTPINLVSHPELKKFQVAVAGIQEVYNCATPTAYKDAKKLPIETALTNSIGVKNVLELAREHNAAMVHLSTSAIYGDPLPETKYFTEDYWGYINPVGERASYNESKRFAETLCTIYREQENVNVSIARIFATYGPRMKMGAARMIPDFIGNALDNKDVVIYGDENSKRGYCYVQDVVDGVFKLMAAKDFGPVNIGNPDEQNLANIAKTVIAKLGSKSKIVYEKTPDGLHVEGLPDIKRAKETLSWYPVVPLADGLEKTIHYIQSARSRYEQAGLWNMDAPNGE
ncbi:MAG: NAD-dependent epimerase/dehydratase family protein [Candidatus Sungbacteria bacterium]|nr:NAD-dependent epimerase/dehydratase family protein [Candidatus Sungbacteria bacterium]